MERKNRKAINNAFYDDLHEKWTDASDHPIALLRAENALRNPWIQSILEKKFPYPCKVLDVGCGGGFLTNYLAKKGHLVSGVDLSSESLSFARSTDSTESVEYVRGSAYELPFADGVFDAVSAMDLLEHVENPALVVKEASRVLKKGGLFFFHTFNRNLLSYFMVIKGVDWCFSGGPKNIHVYPLFIKPEELTESCENHGMKVQEIKGVRPVYKNKAFWKLILTKRMEEDFQFEFTRSLKVGYSGYAEKM